MAKLLIFPNPLTAACILAHDSGLQVMGNDDVDFDGRPGQSFELPIDLPQGNGCSIIINANGKMPFTQRGILWYKDGVLVFPWYADRTAAFVADDFTLVDIPPPVIIEVPAEPEPPVIDPDVPNSPLAVIDAVYDKTNPNLETKDGCGEFTESSVTALHNLSSPFFGHLRKHPPQNNYNGHGVDIAHLLRDFVANDGQIVEAGIYDIIVNSESVDALPSFNYKGPADPNEWYYPA